jgi:hypothetical protein
MPQHADLLSSPANFAVVQLPGRKFPGVVFQGDSLHILVENLRQMSQAATRHDDEKLLAGFEEILSVLDEVTGHYESVCRSRGIPLPYPKP